MDGAREMVRATQALTGRPINANVFCHAPAMRDVDVETAWCAALAPSFARFDARPPEMLHEIYRSFAVDPDMQQMLIDARPGVVSLHFGLPDSAWISALQQAGNLVFATATNVAEARDCEAAGVDVIVAQGIEAGGHRGMFDPDAPDAQLTTEALVVALVAECRAPIVAAGGVMDGTDVARVMRLGAAGAQLGTAFLDCPESQADAGFRAALRQDASHPPVMTRAISGRPARCLQNAFVSTAERLSAQIPDYPVAYDAGKALNAAAKGAGEAGFGAHWAGTGARRARHAGAAQIVTDIGAAWTAAAR